MSDIINLISNNLVEILCTIITTIFGYIGIQVEKIYQEYTLSKLKKEIIDKTVKYVEQTGKDLSCEDKKIKAREKSIKWLNEKKISISDTELEILIESAVKCL